MEEEQQFSVSLPNTIGDDHGHERADSSDVIRPRRSTDNRDNNNHHHNNEGDYFFDSSIRQRPSSSSSGPGKAGPKSPPSTRSPLPTFQQSSMANNKHPMSGFDHPHVGGGETSSPHPHELDHTRHSSTDGGSDEGSNLLLGAHSSSYPHEPPSTPCRSLEKLDSSPGGFHHHFGATKPSTSSSSLPNYIRLNVGGSLYVTTLLTLTKSDHHMFSAMFSGRMPLTFDDSGWIVIDRDGRLFGKILTFLRDGHTALPENMDDLRELLIEAKYYLIDDLVAMIEDRLRVTAHVKPLCVVPVLTSQIEEQKMIASTIDSNPMVKFCYFRGNNKFSYTAPSDDALLRNIELFDKISTRFNGRVNYVKDISGKTGHICAWFFYGHGKLVAEVCCTSLVYSAEKKQTKIEFPEARLFEENMNILLYEKKGGVKAEFDDLPLSTSDFLGRKHNSYYPVIRPSSPL